jgi:hypothetical protein
MKGTSSCLGRDCRCRLQDPLRDETTADGARPHLAPVARLVRIVVVVVAKLGMVGAASWADPRLCVRRRWQRCLPFVRMSPRRSCASGLGVQRRAHHSHACVIFCRPLQWTAALCCVIGVGASQHFGIVTPVGLGTYLAHPQPRRPYDYAADAESAETNLGSQCELRARPASCEMYFRAE